MPKALDTAAREAIADDIRAGKPRNQIARDHHVSGSTVTKIAKDLGLAATAFDRSQTQNATRAKRFDAALARAELIERLYGVAGRFLDRVEAPYTQVVTSPAGPEFVTTKLPPLRDAQAGMLAAAVAMDKALKLEQHDAQDSETGFAAVDEWLASVLSEG